MITNYSQLPDDIDALKNMLLEEQRQSEIREQKLETQKQQISSQLQEISTQEQQISSQTDKIQTQKKCIKSLTGEIESIKEQLRLVISKRFGPSTEKYIPEQKDMFFDEAEAQVIKANNDNRKIKKGQVY